MSKRRNGIELRNHACAISEKAILLAVRIKVKCKACTRPYYGIRPEITCDAFTSPAALHILRLLFR
jgi:hypothetical protein